MLKRKLGFEAVLPPASGDRSWGNRRFFFDKNPKIRTYLGNYQKFALWDMLNGLNKDHIISQIKSHLDGQTLNPILMNHLLCVEAFLNTKMSASTPSPIHGDAR